MPPLFAGARLRALSSRPLRTGLVTAALTAGALVSSVGTTTPAAQAATTTTSTSTPTAAQVRQAKINSVMTWAAKQKGKPYQYGAAGPYRFDCSGLTMYVFKHALGKSLSHNAEAQYRSVTHISRASLRPGDLVFAMSGGSAYHVGIYAGSGYFWHAPHSGTVVKKVKMYSATWRYGRIIH
jgi:cell wall-associated NlpC family hydrolase